MARARAGERRAHAVPLSGRKTTEGGSSGGLGQREELASWAGLLLLGCAGEGRPR